MRAKSLWWPTLAAMAMMYSGRKNSCWYAFKFDWFCITHSFFDQSARGEKLHGKIFDQKMLALDAPALRLKMRVDRSNSAPQCFLAGYKNDIRIIRGDRLGVVDRGESAAERVIFDQSS